MRLTKQQPSKAVKQTDILKWLSLGLLIYMPFHLFLAQYLSTLTGGIEVWKAAKDAVIVLGAILSLLVLIQHNQKHPSRWLERVMVGATAYMVLHLLFIFYKDLDMESALLGTTYNVRLFGLLAIGLATGIKLKTLKFKKKLINWVLYGALVVALLGILQVFLPDDFLTNFGYSFDRGAREYFSIDSKPGLTRIMSTIRDPNSLGAYLLIIWSIAAAVLAKGKRKDLLIALVILTLGAIGLTFSRSAWLGVAVATAWLLYQTGIYKKYINKLFIGSATLIVLMGAVGVFIARDTYIVENIIWHKDETTTDIDSTTKHISYIERSTREIIDNPIGHGPGTAGIVSIRNPDGTTLNENYYLQIGHEVGVLGLALFIWLNVEVMIALNKSKMDYLRLGLMASFFGLIITNMLLHTWSNEAVATTWWLLAGYQIGSSKKLQ